MLMHVPGWFQRLCIALHPQKDYRFDKSSDRGVFRSLRVMALPLLDPGGKSVLGAIQVTRGWAVGLEPDEVSESHRGR
jgi:hypothetical protein